MGDDLGHELQHRRLGEVAALDLEDPVAENVGVVLPQIAEQLVPLGDALRRDAGLLGGGLDHGEPLGDLVGAAAVDAVEIGHAAQQPVRVFALPVEPDAELVGIEAGFGCG